MIETFEIYLDDLNDEARERYLEFVDLEEGGNFEYVPICIIEKEKEEDEE